MNGNSNVGYDPSGRRRLFRQGRLRPHGGEGAIEFADFERLTGREPAFTTLGTEGKIDRTWYPVADLTADATTIQIQTTEFVWLCAQARALRKSVPATSSVALAAHTKRPPIEPTGSYVIAPQDERVVQRRHGSVFTALERFPS